MPRARFFNLGIWVLGVVSGCVPAPAEEIATDADGGRPLLVPLPDGAGDDGDDGCGAGGFADARWMGAGGRDGAAAASGDAVDESGDGGRGPATPADAGQALPDAGAGSPQIATPAEPGALVISEWMADPAALGDTQGEWIELYNPGPAPLDLGGCELSDGPDPGAGLGALVAAAGGYLTLARRGMPGFVPDAVLSFSLRNGSDVMVLRCDGVVIDSVAYAPELGFSVAAGVSNQLDPGSFDAAENDAGSAWCAGSTPYAGDLGTPGAPNLPCAQPDLDAGVP